jgi:hypothetical protein
VPCETAPKKLVFRFSTIFLFQLWPYSEDNVSRQASVEVKLRHDTNQEVPIEFFTYKEQKKKKCVVNFCSSQPARTSFERNYEEVGNLPLELALQNLPDPGLGRGFW